MVISFVRRYIYLVLLIVVIVVLWRSYGPVGTVIYLVIFWALGHVILFVIRRFWRHR